MRTLTAMLVMIGAATVAGCGGGGSTGAPTDSSTVQTPSGPATASTSAAPPAGPSTGDLPGVSPSDAALIAGYRGWTELTRPPVPSLRGLGSAHGGTKRIWASPSRSDLTGAQGQRFPYPRGAVVVKQASSGADVTLLAIMEKVRANDSTTGGWRYVEYTRPAADASFSKVGLSESGCAGCHAAANTTQRTDWVFFSLR